MKNQEAIDKAFEALKTFDWGGDRKPLAALEEAVPESHGDAAARKELEGRLAAALGAKLSLAAKDFVARKLMVVGTAASVPALAALLNDKDLSHLARYALERIPAPEAGKALCDSLSKLSGKHKVGAISSLGTRRETGAVAPLAPLLDDSDAAVAAAAAAALGNIGTAEAAKLLQQSRPADAVKSAVADAVLASAESLTACGNKAAALAAYKSLLAGKPSKNVKLAATRGLLLAGK